MANLQSVKIYPPIGIARIGNSPEWFLGPELPFPAPPQPPPDNKYKDTQCRVRRQAQRFHLWGYFDDATNRELTIADGDIEWRVHLANAKAVFRGEAGGLIDPGPRTLKNANDSATFANGTYTYNGIPVEVPLGNAITDDQGRLIVAGGFGKSDTPVGSAVNPLTWWLENAGWYDDISDGPVNATITVNGQQFPADGAWVICPPPRYAPTTYPVITLYDTMRQQALDLMPPLLSQPGQPVFTTDIYPILTRAIGITRVAAAVFGSGDHTFLPSVLPPNPIGGDSGTRSMIFGKIADPANPNNLGTPDQPQNMPFLKPADGPLPILNEQDLPPTLRPFQYTQMQRWANGDYVADWPPVVPSNITPDGLTQAALENCIGASFYPGIEASITVKDGSLGYSEAFRFDQTNMKPGDVTKVMARPWQADFTACSGGDSLDATAWWPTARPDTVIPEGGTMPRPWTMSLVSNPQEMVDNWFRLGFIVDKGQGAVETEKFAVCKDCFIITARNEIGQEEAQGLINTNESITDAFYVVVEGFSPNDLGITSPNPSPIPAVVGISLNPMPQGMTQQVDSLLLEDNNALGQAQRITFGFKISFQNTNDFASDRTPIQINASVQGVSSSATIYLTKVVSPYMDHGPISWLSNDTRVFKLQPNGYFANTNVQLQNDPNAFIQNVITTLRGMPSNQAYNLFEGLNADETGSELEWLPTLNGQPVYNFALCRVRYRATATVAADVRVFFRLFQTAATGTEYNSQTTYRVSGQPGTKIAVLGIQGGELVTIPFFADPRNAANVPLNLQKDDTNKHSINPNAGEEAYMYFGAWLDINNPMDFRFPIQPSPPDGGPFTGTLLSIADLIRGTHQCMVTEINFDLESIQPQGISTASSDMLSQRNLAIDNSQNPGIEATRRVQHTFAIHPTTANPQPKQGPDEMMILWGNTPPGTVATLYMPGVRTSEVLALAGRRFNLQTLSRVDDHTLSCKTSGVTYVPIPAGGAVDLAGLITLELPMGVRKGQLFRVVVNQVKDTPAPLSVVHGPEATPALRSVAPPKSRRERHVLGAFQFSVLVKTAEDVLKRDERTLTALRRVIPAIPVENRWHPVMQRYLDQMTDRVHAVGGGAVAGAMCGTWAAITSILLAALVAGAGALNGTALTVVELTLAVLLVIAALVWTTKCHLALCRWLRAFVDGIALGAALLAVLWLLGVTAPHLVPVLCVSVVLLALALLIGGLKKCFQ